MKQTAGQLGLAGALRGCSSWQDIQEKWRKFCKGNLPEKGSLPTDISATPSNTYAAKGWVGMGDWLGTGNMQTSRRKFRLFLDARTFARSLRLANWDEWASFCKGYFPDKGILPSDIPTNPQRTYAHSGWAGMSDWLGTNRTRVSKSAKRKS